MISAKHLEKRQREVSALFDEYKNAKVETYISPVNNRQLPKSLEELAAYLKQHKKEAKPDLGLDKANVAKFIAREAKKRVPLDPKISDNTALNR